MTMRFYRVVLDGHGGRREVRVASPTDVQAGDAASPLMNTGESIALIEEVTDDGLQQSDALPPKSQAEEFASPALSSLSANR